MNIIVIDGNVGAGKSTWLEHISHHSDGDIIPIFECVHEFATFKDYNPLMEAYSDPVRNASITQLHILNCIHEQIHRIPSSLKKIFISERSLFSPLVFNDTYLHSGIISPFAHHFITDRVLNRADESIHDLNIKYLSIIFLHTEASICYERIHKRQRSSEVNNITLDHLHNLEREYERHMDWWREYLGTGQVFKIDSAAKSLTQLTEELYKCLGFSSERQ